MNLWCIRSMIPILSLVQFHVIGPSPHSIIRRKSESGCPHFEHAPESASRMAAKRSFVFMMSRIAAHHLDFVVSGTPLACRFFHTRSQSTPANLRTICSSPGMVALLVRWSSTSYNLRLNSIPDRPVRSQSLYRLSYLAHNLKQYYDLI